jgi:hypothetical protein
MITQNLKNLVVKKIKINNKSLLMLENLTRFDKHIFYGLFIMRIQKKCIVSIVHRQDTILDGIKIILILNVNILIIQLN